MLRAGGDGCGAVGPAKDERVALASFRREFVQGCDRGLQGRSWGREETERFKRSAGLNTLRDTQIEDLLAIPQCNVTYTHTLCSPLIRFLPPFKGTKDGASILINIKHSHPQDIHS